MERALFAYFCARSAVFHSGANVHDLFRHGLALRAEVDFIS